MNKTIFILLAITLPQSASAMQRENRRKAREIEKLNLNLIESVYENELKKARQYLAQGADVHAQDREGYTALMHALQKPEKEINEKFCKLLIKKTTNFEIQTKDGMTALRLAISRNQPTICKLLIAKGAQCNGPDESRHLPLFDATCQNKTMCKLLLEAKANVHGKNKTGHTALDFAVRRTETDTSEMLIAARADINTQDNQGWTPLLTAASFDCDEQCALLLSYGANPYARTKKGKTAFMITGGYNSSIDNNEKKTYETLITKPLFLPHRTTAELYESRKRIIAALWVLKFACPNLPRDLKYTILLANNELKQDILNCPFKIHAHRYDNLPYMPLQTIRSLLNGSLLEPEKTVSWLKKNCLNCLEPLLREAYDAIEDKDYLSEEECVFKDILHPDTIDSMHGAEIEKNIRMNLGLK